MLTVHQRYKQTDGRTVGRLTIAILRFAVCASRSKNATAYGEVRKKQKKLGELCGFVGRSRAKKLSASGGFAPLTPHQGLCP